MTSTEGLVERLERATEGSRDFDWWIAYITGHPAMEGARDVGEGAIGFLPFVPGSAADQSIPTYTTSIDAAETLWPETDKPKKLLQYWTDYRPGGQMYWRVKALEFTPGKRLVERAIGNHRRKPIAAVIAALKAREAS